jgi:RHS repeat-associated protein
MLTRAGTQNLTWNAENRLASVGDSVYTYERDGTRVKKIENGETTVYIGKYYEKNVITGTETLYYFLGNKLAGYQVHSTVSSDMRYLHQDHLGATTIVTDADGDAVFERSYDPRGNICVASGTADMDRLYTGQRYDAATGLYYYNARYYDPTLARFISPDTIVPDVDDPRAWNGYAYVANNPLRYNDPTGHCGLDIFLNVAFTAWSAWDFARHPSWSNAGWFGADAAGLFIPCAAGLGRLGKSVDRPLHLAGHDRAGHRRPTGVEPLRESLP